MGFSSDLEESAEYTTSAAPPPRPTLSRNLGCWLLAMLLGVVLLLFGADNQWQ